MAISYVTNGHVGSSLGQHGGTSGTFDSTGGDLLVIAVAADSGVTLVAGDISDSKGNSSWVRVGATYASGTATRIHIFYHASPTVGTSHTVTVTKNSSFASICVATFSGAHTSPLDLEAGGGQASGTSVQPSASITPSEANCVVISGLVDNDGGTLTDPSGFTRTDRVAHIGGTSYGSAMAYKIQGSATSEQPQWSWTNTTDGATQAASFKSAAGGGGGGGGRRPRGRLTLGVG